jgi:hypothetical protein
MSSSISNTTIRLRAADGCKCCHGKGFFSESHGNSMWGGEQIPCDCLWENDGIDYDDPKIAGMIDRGEYEILPSYALEQSWEDDIESRPN